MGAPRFSAPLQVPRSTGRRLPVIESHSGIRSSSKSNWGHSTHHSHAWCSKGCARRISWNIDADSSFWMTHWLSLHTFSKSTWMPAAPSAITSYLEFRTPRLAILGRTLPSSRRFNTRSPTFVGNTLGLGTVGPAMRYLGQKQITMPIWRRTQAITRPSRPPSQATMMRRCGVSTKNWDNAKTRRDWTSGVMVRGQKTANPRPKPVRGWTVRCRRPRPAGHLKPAGMLGRTGMCSTPRHFHPSMPLPTINPMAQRNLPRFLHMAPRLLGNPFRPWQGVWNGIQHQVVVVRRQTTVNAGRNLHPRNLVLPPLAIPAAHLQLQRQPSQIGG